MNRLMGCFLLAVGLCLLPNVTHVWTRFESDVTVYMLSCDGAQMDGTCEGTETTDVPFTYQVSVDQHSVRYWRLSDPDVIRGLTFCAIHDSKSWLCQWNGDDAPKSRFGMEAGRYVEIGTCMTTAPGPVFYQVSMWRWWLVWVEQKFLSTAARSTAARSMG